ncbi:MAG: hypothetical protein AB7E52_03895 [Bdellovibrionales bacterium]
MKSLATLIKLQKTRVDEQRLILAKMQEQLARAIQEIEDFEAEQEAQRELLHQDPAYALTYGPYIKRALAQREGLERKRRAAEHAVNLAHEKMAFLFEEQKRYEIAEENRLEEEERIEQQRERKTLDEIGSISFVRRKKQEGMP